MPFKNYQDKLNWNKNRVNHYRNNGNGGIRINLNGIKKRLNVCELCGDVGKTEFHEYTSNPKEVLELCHYCHELITLKAFDENKLFI